MENPASLKEQFTFVQTDSKQSEYHDVSNISLSFRKKAWLKLKSNKAAMISLTFLVLIALLSVISLFWLPHNPNAQNVNESNLKPFTNSAYLLGTDNLGRDMLSRLLYGTRISLMIALFATAVDILIGVPYGMISGWCGGRVDNLMQRVIEIISSIPELVLIMLLLIVFKPGMTSIIFAVALSSWVLMARLVRASTMQIKSSDYVLAARAMGEGPVKIWFDIFFLTQWA